MSGCLAYRIAVVLMIGPFVILPLFAVYCVHRNHEVHRAFQAEVIAAHARAEAMLAKAEAEQRAHNK